MRKRWFRWALAVVAAFWLGLGAYPVVAQSTGGSFGGGSFGGGGGGGSYGGGGGSYGGGSSYGGGYSSGGYSGGGGGGGGLSCACVVPLIIGLVLLVIVTNAMKKKGGSSHGSRAWGNVDISAIRLGVDWRARRELQAHLERLAKSGQTNSQAGLANLLRETILGLRRAELAWLYADVSNYKPMSAASAEGIFRQLGSDARARFRHELVRNADGTQTSKDAPEMRAHPNEGEGVVVVTLIVAARREILDVANVQDANGLRALLDDMTAVANPHTLMALEVIWSPAAENDRMSTAELEQFYPQLKKIDERSIAGRVFCAYCKGPFAMELLNCPHCGAPAPGTDHQHG
ncbi:MAG: DUF1517 domain-containing protein [Sandaracinaceae bacterium]